MNGLVCQCNDDHGLRLERKDVRKNDEMLSFRKLSVIPP